MPGRTRSISCFRERSAWRPSWRGAGPRAVRRPPRRARPRRRNPRSWRGDGRVAGLVGAGEVGPQADDPTWPSASASQRGVDQRRASRRGSAPPRDSPVSAFRCSRAGRPVRAAAAAISRTSAGASWPTGRRRPRRLVERPRPARSSQHSSRDVDARPPQRERLVQQWRRPARSPADERRARDRDQAVAVPVGLDDRHQASRPWRARAAARRCGGSRPGRRAPPW